MKIHLIGGFLGSGKTTAIKMATEMLLDKNIITSVITNDQGYYLVDSQILKMNNISTEEVTGGCFCCNYNQLDSQIDKLQREINPSVIFAESVGSCTDLVATVLKPLLKYKSSDNIQMTLSTFVDSRILLAFLQGKTLPFSVETNYIWEKQVEEADVLIVNKIDLLSVEKFDLLKSKMKDIYPFKQILYQNSLLKDSVNEWIEIIGSHKKTKEYAIIDVDYLKYAVGEANLAWLDEKIEIITKDNSSVEKVYTLIDNIKKAIERNNFSIGHLKFHLSFNNKSVKVSYTTILQDDNMNEVVREKSNHVELIVNARIESTPNDLNEIFKNAIDVMRTKDAVVINENYLAYFQPGFPNPTHRLV